MLRPELLVGSAMVATAQRRLADAQASLVEARGIVEERVMRHVFPRLDLAEGTFWSANGDPGRGVQHLDRAASAARALRMRPLLWRILLELARVLESSDRGSEASAWRAQAGAVVRSIAADIHDDGRRSRFLAHAGRRLEKPQ